MLLKLGRFCSIVHDVWGELMDPPFVCRYMKLLLSSLGLVVEVKMMLTSVVRGRFLPLGYYVHSDNPLCDRVNFGEFSCRWG